MPPACRGAASSIKRIQQSAKNMHPLMRGIMYKGAI